ncbi:MAG: sulfotransferase [Rhodospirillales bacterium]|nr:sulfotransferase [Rhodospirillales bacterium]
MIVIGLGSGRSGTASLAKLLNAQRDALCFHEMNPSAVRFSGTPRPFLNTIDEFQKILDGGDPAMLTVDLSRGVAAKAYDQLCRMQRVRMIGDIAFYYLTYVERLTRHNPNIRFVCLRRDREETIQSWMRKSAVERWRSKRIADRISSLITRERYHESRNFWMDHDGSRWQKDPVWDKCFPKFAAKTKREAVGMYWDYYYEQAEILGQKLGEVFRVVDTEFLGEANFQTELLEYCGIPVHEQVHVDAHIHRSSEE